MNFKNLKKLIGNNKLRIAEGGCLMIALALVITTAITITYQRLTLTGAYRQEYSGRIIDKATRFHESEEGSSMGRYLIIEGKSGSRSEISVSEDVYNRARIGMWIEKSNKGTELAPSQ